jgi:hypothetical protein
MSSRNCAPAQYPGPRLPSVQYAFWVPALGGLVDGQLGYRFSHWRLIRLVAGVGARAVSLARAAGASRECDGYAGAPWAARGPVFLRPQEASRQPPRKPLRASWDLGGPQGCLAAPAWRRFWAPLQAAAGACSCERGSGHVPLGGRRTPRPLLALRRQRSQRASWISNPPRALLPGAGRCHVKDGVHFASRRRQRRRILGTALASGDKQGGRHFISLRGGE